MSEKYKEMTFVELAELYRVVVEQEQARVLKKKSLEGKVNQLATDYKNAQKELIEYQAAAVDSESQAILAEIGDRIAAGGADPDTADPETEADKPSRGRKVKKDD